MAPGQASVGVGVKGKHLAIGFRLSLAIGRGSFPRDELGRSSASILIARFDSCAISLNEANVSALLYAGSA